MKSILYMLVLLLFPINSFAASGNVQVISAIISEDGQAVNVSVEYIITSDDVPEAHSTYNTNGYYKECFSPTQDLSGSCNTHRYAYFKRSTDLIGSFDGSSSVERFWCPGGIDDMGVTKSMSEALTIPADATGGSEMSATYYLEDVAGSGYQLYYGQIYSCRTSTRHPDYQEVFASATVSFKLSEDGQCFRCVDSDNDGLYAVSSRCPEGDDCDDSDPDVGVQCPAEIPASDFPRDECTKIH